MLELVVVVDVELLVVEIVLEVVVCVVERVVVVVGLKVVVVKSGGVVTDATAINPEAGDASRPVTASNTTERSVSSLFIAFIVLASSTTLRSL